VLRARVRGHATTVAGAEQRMLAGEPMPDIERVNKRVRGWGIGSSLTHSSRTQSAVRLDGKPIDVG
jgi:hypothetical protein